jgi:hypothetical protein
VKAQETRLSLCCRRLLKESIYILTLYILPEGEITLEQAREIIRSISFAETLHPGFVSAVCRP